MKNSYRETIAGLLARAYPKLATTHRLEFKTYLEQSGDM